MDISQSPGQAALRSPASSSPGLPPSGPSPAGTGGWGEDGFGFDDLIDIVNPLQHLPFVSTLYREFTGDQISPAARMTGSTIYGGPLGLVAGLANVFIEAETGKDLGGTVVAALTGREDDLAAPEDTRVLAGIPGDEAPATENPVSANLAATAPGAIPRIGPGGTGTGTGGINLGALPSPEALAAYAGADALGLPAQQGQGAGEFRLAAAQGTPQAALQNVPGRGLDALIRESQGIRESQAARDSQESRTATAPGNNPVLPDNRAGLADWMLRALDKYENLKIPGRETGQKTG